MEERKIERERKQGTLLESIQTGSLPEKPRAPGVQSWGCWCLSRLLVLQQATYQGLWAVRAEELCGGLWGPPVLLDIILAVTIVLLRWVIHAPLITLASSCRQDLVLLNASFRGHVLPIWSSMVVLCLPCPQLGTHFFGSEPLQYASPNGLERPSPGLGP